MHMKMKKETWWGKGENRQAGSIMLDDDTRDGLGGLLIPARAPQLTFLCVLRNGTFCIHRRLHTATKTLQSSPTHTWHSINWIRCTASRNTMWNLEAYHASIMYQILCNTTFVRTAGRSLMGPILARFVCAVLKRQVRRSNSTRIQDLPNITEYLKTLSVGS